MIRAINVAFCFDEKYQQHAAAAIMSVIANFESGCENLSLHLVTENPTPKLSSYSISLEKTYGCTVIIHDVGMHTETANRLRAISEAAMGRWSKAALFRLLLPSILPIEVKEVLYLDSDIIVLRDVSQLFAIDIGDALTGAVRDPNEEEGRQHTGTKQYYNAGVLLIKLDLWRDNEISSKCFNYLLDPDTSKICFDQDAINVVLQDQIFELPKQWNTQITNETNPSNSYLASIHEHVFILHFITINKPWQAWYKNRLGEFYWNYLNASPWRGAAVEQPKTVSQHWLLALKHTAAGNLKDAIVIYERIAKHFLLKS